jgi:2-polyprenyl-3-methyl-5-hydroxy-6-metoxy-1,4-benzoquinol methylase
MSTSRSTRCSIGITALLEEVVSAPWIAQDRSSATLETNPFGWYPDQPCRGELRSRHPAALRPQPTTNLTAISQWISPRAFELFQFWIGGTIAKRDLVLRYYSNQKRILEVGCSIGNIASAFRGLNVDYIGLDVDASAVDYAQRKFKRRGAFSFVCGNLWEHQFDHEFDYIVFSAILHHVDDVTAISHLEYCKKILSPRGTVLVSDPIRPRSTDSTLVKLYRKMERGQYVRTFEELSALIAKVQGLRVVEHTCQPVTALPFLSKPTVSYFGLFLLEHPGASAL